MPRDSQGRYTLPAGNPVVTNTTIATSWANGTLSDLKTEMENSLDRNGRGGMLAALQLYAGSRAAPGVAFTDEPGLGFYRAGAKDVRLAAANADIVKFTDVYLDASTLSLYSKNRFFANGASYQYQGNGGSVVTHSSLASVNLFDTIVQQVNDTGFSWDNTNKQLTIPVAGVYLIHALVEMRFTPTVPAGSSASALATLTLQGTPFPTSPATESVYILPSASQITEVIDRAGVVFAVAALNAGATISLQALTNPVTSGGATISVRYTPKMLNVIRIA